MRILKGIKTKLLTKKKQNNLPSISQIIIISI